MITIKQLRTCAKYALAGAAVVAIAKSAYKLGCAVYNDRSADYDLYNKLGDGLAMDHLIEDGQANLLNPEDVSSSALVSSIPSVEGITVVAVPNTSKNVIRDGMELEMTPVKEKRHRRIGTHRKHSYASDVIAECRVRFGCPSNNPANRLAVRRFAMNVMYSHGLRPTHVCAVIDDIVEMVFKESDQLIASRRLSKTIWGRIRALWGPSPQQSN